MKVIKRKRHRRKKRSFIVMRNYGNYVHFYLNFRRVGCMWKKSSSKLIKKDVGEVGGRFDFCLKLFVTIPVPDVRTRVPGRVWWDPSNGRTSFYTSGINNGISTKMFQSSMENKIWKTYLPKIFVPLRVPKMRPSPKRCSFTSSTRKCIRYSHRYIKISN